MDTKNKPGSLCPLCRTYGRCGHRRGYPALHSRCGEFELQHDSNRAAAAKAGRADACAVKGAASKRRGGN